MDVSRTGLSCRGLRRNERAWNIKRRTNKVTASGTAITTTHEVKSDAPVTLPAHCEYKHEKKTFFGHSSFGQCMCVSVYVYVYSISMVDYFYSHSSFIWIHQRARNIHIWWIFRSLCVPLTKMNATNHTINEYTMSRWVSHTDLMLLWAISLQSIRSLTHSGSYGAGLIGFPLGKYDDMVREKSNCSRKSYGIVNSPVSIFTTIP